MDTKHLLKEHGLSLTSCRMDVLKRFLGAGSAVSFHDVEISLQNSYDRVTIYRTLKAFVEKGIIHKVLDNTGSLKYALCSDHCHEADHDHEHLHFKCVKCEETNCIDDIKIPKIELPKGYSFMKSDLLIQGVCRKCNAAA
jgi:Fur family transcriptional regulator, ferric uptake regulator